MTAIEFFEKQTEIWDIERFCNNCWDFSAPMSESAANIQQLRKNKECCYQLMVTDYRHSRREEYSTIGLVSRVVCEERMTIYVVKAGSIGINNYNEIDGHFTSESKWESVLKPLFECFSCEDILAKCEILGYQFRIPVWDVEKVIDWNDNNYTGIKINAVFRTIL